MEKKVISKLLPWKMSEAPRREDSLRGLYSYSRFTVLCFKGSESGAMASLTWLLMRFKGEQSWSEPMCCKYS